MFHQTQSQTIVYLYKVGILIVLKYLSMHLTERVYTKVYSRYVCNLSFLEEQKRINDISYEVAQGNLS